MTDLTEQWKKGELINGKKYYITFFDSEPFEATFRRVDKAICPYWKFEAHGRQYCDENGYDCVKVLAPVPSYEEWQASEKYNKHLEEVIKVYERKDKQATETSIAYNELAEENEKLKEIIEKDKKVFAESRIYPAHLISEDFPVKYDIDKLKELLKEVKDYLPEFETPMNILAKIDEVLK